MYEAFLKNAILMQILILKNTVIDKTMTREQQTVHYKAFTNVIKTICRYLNPKPLIYVSNYIKDVRQTFSIDYLLHYLYTV